MTREVVAVILAAGAGRRLGGTAKALMRVSAGAASGANGAMTCLARVAASASGGGIGRAVVVVGPPHGAEVGSEARRLGLEVADNPDPDRGMASSVALGFEHAASHFATASSALLWPVDHAGVAPATVSRLVALAAVEPHRILVPTWLGRGGHPTAFGREFWPELTGCADLPRGARTLLERRAERVCRVAFDDAAVAADIDRPADLG